MYQDEFALSRAAQHLEALQQEAEAYRASKQRPVLGYRARLAQRLKRLAAWLEPDSEAGAYLTESTP